MPEQLEDALTRTLSAAAGTAPLQSDGLLHDVDVRFRRRRRRRYAAVAGAAAFTLLLGGAAVATDVVSLPRTEDSGTGRVVTGARGAEPPIADMWPKAYHRISGKLTDGPKVRPVELLNETELLAATSASFEKDDALWIIDIESGKARRIVELPGPAEGRHHSYASHYTVREDLVVWWDSYRRNGEGHTRIWKAPISGGEPRLVATVPGGHGSVGPRGDRLAVSDRYVYYSGEAKRAEGHVVQRVPLAGGEPEKVPYSDGFEIVAWPWIGSAVDEQAEFRNGDGVVEYQTLRDLETGATRGAADAERGEYWTCVVTWCLESSKDGLRVRHRDGSNEVTLPDVAPSPDITVAYDRFVLSTLPHPELYDLKTGKHSDFGVKPDPDGDMAHVGVRTPDTQLVYWTLDDGKTWSLLDLAAIE